MFRWKLMLRNLFASRSHQPKVRRSRRTVRPHLEALEDRTLLSGSLGIPLPVFSVASPAPASSAAVLLSYAADRINQWHHLVETVQQEVFGFWTAVGQNIAHEVSFFVQQWDRLLGINPNPQHPSLNNAAPQHGSSLDTRQAAHTVVISHVPPPSLHFKPLDAPPGLPPPPPPPGIYVYFNSSSYSVMENAGLADIQVDLSATPQQPVSVQFYTYNGTATAGVDYGAENGIPVNFQAGVTSQTVNVMIFDDGASDESVGSEYFSVQLANPNGATLGNPSSATVTISEVSPPPPPPPPPGPPTVSFSSSTYSVTEGNTATITATLSTAPL